MKSTDFKRLIIKAIYTANDFINYPEEIEFDEVNWLSSVLDKTIKKEMTGKIKEKGRVGKFENKFSILWKYNADIQIYAQNAKGEWYPINFNVSKEDVIYSYD